MDAMRVRLFGRFWKNAHAGWTAMVQSEAGKSRRSNEAAVVLRRPSQEAGSAWQLVSWAAKWHDVWERHREPPTAARVTTRALLKVRVGTAAMVSTNTLFPQLVVKMIL